MPAERRSRSLTRLALSILLAATASTASAQSRQSSQADLGTVLQPGMTVWITDASGQERKTRILDVSGETVTAGAPDGARRLSIADISRVKVRHSDSVLNGAVIGAGAAVASGLFLCSLTEPWENCRDDVGPMIRIGALGAGIGIGIDALIRGRTTIYDAGGGSIRVQAAPIVGRGTRGVRVALTF
jgi:hypothetical protein